MSERLRVAVLLGREPLRRFEASVIDAIACAPRAKLVAVLREERASLASVAPGSHGVAGRALAALDARLFARPDDALAATPGRAGESDAGRAREVIASIVPIASEAELAERLAQVDVLLCLSARSESELLALPRPPAGTWWPGDASSAPGAATLPGRDETLAGRDVTRMGVAVARPGAPPGWGAVAVLATDARSPHRTLAAAAERIAGLVEDLLRDSARASRPPEPGSGLAAHGGRRGARAPGAVGGTLRIARRLVSDRLDARRVRERWGIAVALDPPDPFDPRTFGRLEAPGGGLYADPFPVQHDDGWWLFVEEVRPGEARGVISVIPIDSSGRADAPRAVLEAPHHLSYPFVFAWQGERWLIPESADARRLDLWRAVEWPWRWERERTLLDGVRAFDATLVEMSGRWHLFASIETRAALGFDELHAFEAESPLGPFTPHPANPLLRDVRAARPAGRMLADARGWLRPAQDCSRRYGGATVLRRIERFDERGLVEQTERRIDPWADDVAATHTWNRAGRLVVVDAVFRHRR